MIKLKNESINYITFFSNKLKIKDSIYYKQLYQYLSKYYTNDKIGYKLEEKPSNINVNENMFLSNNIKNHIYKLQRYHLLKFRINNNNVKISIYHNDKNIDGFANIIVIYIKYMYLIGNYKKNIDITYYLTDCKKVMKNKILTTDEVNTGSTNMKTNKIEIWRKEEVYKTTIHELIHLMKLDDQHKNDLESYYKNKYNCSSNHIIVNEAITDFWAILINIFLMTKLLTYNYKFFLKLIHLEKIFIKYQAQKILSLNHNYNKYTNVLSYYVIKAELFENLPKTLKIIEIEINNYNKLYDYMKTLKPILPSIDSKDRTLKMTMIELI
jgi:hypothetical protein